MGDHALLLLAALVLDWLVGDPDWLWRKIAHPVALMGSMLSWLEKRFNQHELSPAVLMRRGAIVVVLLIILWLEIGRLLEYFLGKIGLTGSVLEIVVVAIFLAQNSLYSHVGAVGRSLREGGLEAGRKAVGKIVGRDPAQLDISGVARAAIETLAENFSDGVVAPAFWYLVFGLPGLITYKMINTADSMIAHKNERYRHFGWSAAKIDDLANWVPARISAMMLGLGGYLTGGRSQGLAAFNVVLRDAGLHSSPNAGWPEAAMAGAGDFALGGPRIYGGKKVSQAFINATGKRDLHAADISAAMAIFSVACYLVWGVVALVGGWIMIALA